MDNGDTNTISTYWEHFIMLKWPSCTLVIVLYSNYDIPSRYSIIVTDIVFALETLFIMLT